MSHAGISEGTMQGAAVATLTPSMKGLHERAGLYQGMDGFRLGVAPGSIWPELVPVYSGVPGLGARTVVNQPRDIEGAMEADRKEGLTQDLGMSKREMELMVEVRNLRELVWSSERALEESEVRRKEIAAKNMILEERLCTADARESFLNNKVADLQAREAKLSEDAKHLEQKLKEGANDLEFYRRQHRENEEKVYSLELKNRRLEEELEVLQRKLDDIINSDKEEKKKMEAELHSLRMLPAAVETLRRENSNCKTKLHKTENEVMQLKDYVATLKHEIQDLEKGRRLSSADNDNLRKESNMLKLQVTSKDATISQLQTSLANCKDDNVQLAQQLRRLEHAAFHFKSSPAPRTAGSGSPLGGAFSSAPWAGEMISSPPAQDLRAMPSRARGMETSFDLFTGGPYIQRNFSPRQDDAELGGFNGGNRRWRPPVLDGEQPSSRGKDSELWELHEAPRVARRHSTPGYLERDPMPPADVEPSRPARWSTSNIEKPISMQDDWERPGSDLQGTGNPKGQKTSHGEGALERNGGELRSDAQKRDLNCWGRSEGGSGFAEGQQRQFPTLQLRESDNAVARAAKGEGDVAAGSPLGSNTSSPRTSAAAGLPSSPHGDNRTMNLIFGGSEGGGGQRTRFAGADAGVEGGPAGKVAGGLAGKVAESPRSTEAVGRGRAPGTRHPSYTSEKEVQEKLQQSCGLELQLSNMCMERQKLESELVKLPQSAGRTMSERKKKMFLENRLEELNKEIGRLRMKLREMNVFH
ncbi:hypothetical protein CBR_g34888 [Chara braunii]|uniref:Enkurin domain-containing protein n=1 Tax=Chara braunii TaxID=69332 RepID=A0A388LJT0_CHABU|nr:hypothetical protein CBR_g34888 [Chara braunii]|eukprot:GBG82511.1 hypothetical protein CBR_g34888 [Chara braunii]